eukprot:TRINITY_DN13919_c0_g1_i1.p1 TRINITY_DN13919_c0_g1~~TRINITY_DN13919_c0_g1_i1.p1  ORF type:complete len:476 (+),score=50.03 TRINITY_DN13919_c0_g1_i1:2386-3813(+)
MWRFRSLQEAGDGALRSCFTLCNTSDSFAVFKRNLLSGDTNKYRATELKAILKELSKGYSGEVAVNWNVCKSDLVKQLKDMSTPITPKKASPSKASLPPNGSSTRAHLKRQADEPSDNFLKRHTRGGEWEPSTIFSRLCEDLNLSGHQQPHTPTQRWLDEEAITVLKASASTTKVRVNLKLTLKPHEHKSLTNRKRLHSLQLVCLDKNLRPAQWPESLQVKAGPNKINLEVPHAAWRCKDDSREWYRVCSPIDLSSHVSMITLSLPVVVEVSKVVNSVIIAACVVQNIGMTTLCEQIKSGIESRPAIQPQAECLSPDVVVDKATASLLDPVTLKRIKCPVRGVSCSHLSAFDLETYVHFCSSSRIWVCPECEAPAPISDLIYDPFMESILKELSDREDITQVIVNSDQTWIAKEPDVQTSSSQSGSRKKSSVAAVLDLEDEDIPGLDSFFEDDELSRPSCFTQRPTGTADCPIEL